MDPCEGVLVFWGADGVWVFGWVPAELTEVSVVVIAVMLPAVADGWFDAAEAEVPTCARLDGVTVAQRCGGDGFQPRLFDECTHGGADRGFAGFHTAFDQLDACMGMVQQQVAHWAAIGVQNHGAGFMDHGLKGAMPWRASSSARSFSG